MSRATKKRVILASILLLLGVLLFAGAMTVLKWDFTKLSTNEYQTVTHEITEAFRGITIRADTADVVFVASEDESCTVECYEQKNITHSVAVKDGVLVIESIDERKWYEHIGINFSTSKITVRVPQGEYGALQIESDTGDIEIPKALCFARMDIAVSTADVKSGANVQGEVKIKTTTGNIVVENGAAGALTLSVSTGDVNVSGVRCTGDVTVNVSTGKTSLKDLVCSNVISKGDTGDMLLKNVVATGSFSLERSTGDVRFERCDAASLVIETSTGDVTGSLLGDKVFFAKTDTGKVEVPKTASGGRCEITTDTGDIRISIAK